MKKYFISKGNLPQGPFSIEELKELDITKTTLVWFEGCENWIEAGTVEEIASIITNTPPPIKRNDEKSEIRNIKIAKSIKWNTKLLMYTLPLIPITYIIVAIAFGGFTALNYQKLDIDKISVLETYDVYYEKAYPIESTISKYLPKDIEYLSSLWNTNVIAIDDETVFNPHNYILDKHKFYEVTDYIVNRAFGWENIRICLIVFILGFSTPYVFKGLKKTSGAVKKSADWIEENSKKEIN